MKIDPVAVKRLTDRAAELFDVDAPQTAIDVAFREQRIRFFTGMWDYMSMHADEIADNGALNGECLDPDQRRELYRVQMHNTVMVAVMGTIHSRCRPNFVDGFIEAAATAATIGPSDFKWYNPEIGGAIDYPEDVVRRFGIAFKRTVVFVTDALNEETAVALIAARQADSMAIIPGYQDARLKSTCSTRSMDLDPVRLPNKPFNDVDYVEDVLMGLQAAGNGDKMKTEEHDFIAKRIALNEIRLWRGNYYKLEI